MFPQKIYSIASMNKNQNIKVQQFLTMIENDNPYKLGIQPGKSEILLKEKFKQHTRFW